MRKGAFIAIEGGDGAGKDTQIELLKKEFSGEQFIYTREPGGTELGKVLRNMVLHESHGALSLLTETFLFLADRAHHADTVIRPALAAGKHIVSNRSWISTIAFQIYGREMFELQPLVEVAIAQIFKDCPIDLAVILDLPPEVGEERQRKAGKELDIMETMPLAARERVRRGFLDTAKKLPGAVVIDADRPIEAVYADVRAAVLKTVGVPA